MTTFALLSELEAYIASDASEVSAVDRTRAFVSAEADAFERTLRPGHVTGSAWIVDRRGTSAVLLHHRKLGQWLQLGGHADGDRNVRAVALREAREESGLASLVLVTGGIYDVDVHDIPARGDEPAHVHYDIRFALFADPAEQPRANAESHAVAWIALRDLDRYAIDASVRRLRAKTDALVRAYGDRYGRAL